MNFARAEKLLEKLEQTQTFSGPGRALEVSEDSPPRFSVAGRTLHSRYDPVKEARQQIGDSGHGTLTVCAGAGLGFAVEVLLGQQSRVIWFEPNREILRAALEHIDFSRALGTGDLVLLVRLPDESELARMLQGLSMNDVRVFSHRNFSFEEHLAFEHRVLHFLGKKNVNMATLSRFDRLWARNFARNLVYLKRAMPVRLLFGLEKGKVAVVASAGPSLNDSLGDLRRVRNQIVLIAVDTAVRILTSAGIDPDYIVSVDPQPVNRVYLEDYTGDARIVIDPTVSTGALRHLQKLYFFWSPFRLPQTFFSLWQGGPGEIAFGGSVSTNAYDLARKLGCDPVYLVGQDLAFSDGQVHARGAILEERLNWKETRLFRREGHNRMQRAALPVLLLPGLNGRAVETNEKLAIFYRWFERRFERDKSEGLRVLNATRRGAAFRGMEKSELNISGEDVRRSSEPVFVGPTWAEIAAQLEVFVSELVAVKGILDNGIALSKGSEQNARRLTEELDRIDERLRGHSTMLDCLGLTAQRAILGITEGLSESDGLENARKLYQALYDGACNYDIWFGKALKVVKNMGGA
ncbi:MAG: motility associated factor glycosyltransferase family protein [Leptospirales bacterium]|nr:motility associated factor glycosyltransferase family protein [Leptospirales bacterium]